MAAGFKTDQSMWHEQHVRVIDVHFPKSRRLNLHDVTIDQNLTDVLQSLLSATERLPRECIF